MASPAVQYVLDRSRKTYLHGIGDEIVAIHTGHDSLATPWSRGCSLILANPPFGNKQSLNFVQHIYTLLKIDGRAAMGGAGQRVVRGRRG